MKLLINNTKTMLMTKEKDDIFNYIHSSVRI